MRKRRCGRWATKPAGSCARAVSPPIPACPRAFRPNTPAFARIVQRCFGPKRFQAIEPRIREIVNQALDRRFQAKRPLRISSREFAYDVPALVLFRAGRRARRPTFPRSRPGHQSRDADLGRSLSDEEQIPHAHTMVEYWRYCRELSRSRHEDPTDDLPGDLVRAQQNGEEISDDEIAGVLYSTCSPATRPRPT